MSAKFIVVDVEGGPAGGTWAGPGCMGEFGAVVYDAPPFTQRFHGRDDSEGEMKRFLEWLKDVCGGGARPMFVSDNPAYDWQHMNWALWNRTGANPFGHSARRIGDYWAGMRGNWRDTQTWKRMRRTPHDHNPVHDALGNAEAMWEMGVRP